ncbi:MAG: hydroxymethylbilane synthase [Parvularculales bacterium]
MQRPLRIGTRTSRLSLAQTQSVVSLLQTAHGLDTRDIEVVPIKTRGDKITDRKLADIGGKGLFTAEMEQRLRDKTLDIAVHSMKDVTVDLPDGLIIAALLSRADPRDALVSNHPPSKDGKTGLAALPPNAHIGTASVRRTAQIKHLRPDISTGLLRGNIDTRLKRLEEGARDGTMDATILALAGLERIDRTDCISAILEPDEMLPAPAQGVIGIECRADDTAIHDLLTPLHDSSTAFCVVAERAFLGALDGSCHTPIGALATLSGTRLRLRGQLLSLDGSRCETIDITGHPDEAETMGCNGAETVRQRMTTHNE